MNNKGFSLIELLAVIVILGIIGTIGVLSYTVVTDNVENKVFTTYEKSMKDSAMMYIIDNGYPNSGKILLSDLLNGIYIEDFENPSSNDKCLNSYVNVTKNNGDKTDLSYKSCLVCDNYKTSGC